MQVSEIADDTSQIGVAARRQDSDSLLLGHATAQAKERISVRQDGLGKIVHGGGSAATNLPMISANRSTSSARRSTW